MKTLIPVYYSEYGRYIARFRSFPLDVDCLKPAERRVLLGLYDIARDKLVKSLKIDGYVVGSYHPHGSCYGTLVGLVREGFASSAGGSWGGPGLKEDFSASSSRYTETHLEKWVEEFAFELYKFVPWDILEMENEPIYLPSIVPIGLIGDGVSIGIGYSKSVMPKYTLKDLAKRLLWLINNKGKSKIPDSWDIDMDEKIFGPKIMPNVSCCDSIETNKNEAYKILTTGSGSITYIPKYKITTMSINKNNKVKQVKLINLLGRVPNTSFKSLVNAWNDGLYGISNICDGSKGNNIDITIEVKNTAEIDKIRETIWNECLIKPISYSCIVCNLSGQVVTESIDELLIKGFKAWMTAKKLKLVQDVKDLNKSIISNEIRLEIKKCLKNHNINTFDELMKAFSKNLAVDLKEFDGSKWLINKKLITEDEVKDVYKSSSIQKLVEYKSSKETLDKKFNELEDSINNLNKYVITKIQGYL